jgi:hypothetical protein
LSRDPAVRRVMMMNGYTKIDHKEGWDLLLDLIGYNDWEADDQQVGSISMQDAAIVALDQWDGPTFERAYAAMERLHPTQCAYVFRELQAATGVAAVGTVKTFIDRVVALREGTDPGRKKTREGDRAAVATLEARGIFDAKTEKWLRGLIEQATSLEAPREPEVPKAEAERMEKAIAFNAWLKDWRTTARAVIARRDYLIRLGLAERRAAGKLGEEVEEETTPTEPAPTMLP